MNIKYPAHVLVFYSGIQKIVSFSIPEMWINVSTNGIKFKKKEDEFDDPPDGAFNPMLEESGFESKIWINNFGINLIVVGALTIGILVSLISVLIIN